MNLNYPRWEGHQYNRRKENPVHYNNSAAETQRIRNLHATEERTPLNEWRLQGTLSSQHGQLNMQPENHALSDDRHGLVVDHLNQVSRLVDEEQVHKFVQDVNEMEDRMSFIKKNR